MIAARVNTSRVVATYLEAVWATPRVREFLEGRSRTTSGIHKVNQKVLLSTRLALPPISVQQRYAQLVERVDASRKRLLDPATTRLIESLAQQFFGAPRHVSGPADDSLAI